MQSQRTAASSYLTGTKHTFLWHWLWLTVICTTICDTLQYDQHFKYRRCTGTYGSRLRKGSGSSRLLLVSWR